MGTNQGSKTQPSQVARPDVSAIAETVFARVSKSLAAMPFGSPPDDLPGLRQEIAFINLSRLRLIALALILTQPLLIAVDWQALSSTPSVAQPFPWSGSLVVAFRVCLGFASILLLAVYRGVSSAAQIGRRMVVFQHGFIVFCLVIAAVWTGVRWPVSITVYLLAVFAASALIHLSPRVAAATYGAAWLALTMALLAPQPLAPAVIPYLANGTLLSVVALAISRVTYNNQVRELQNEQLIARQSKELEEVNQQLAESNAMLHRLSFFDALTGVPNRRYLDEYLRREWRRTHRERLPLAAVMIDIDFFKQFNDTYGHQAGDACLVRVAEAIGSVLNPTGELVARYGGDEFVVVLPNKDLDEAIALAERIRASVLALSALHAGSPLYQVTISLGVGSLLPASGGDIEKLLAAVDEALYRAKAGGRNRCVSAE